jgi:hypothetical protein
MTLKMTKQEVFELSNNDPEHYGEISARIDIPWNCRRVKYWVDCVNSFSEMLVTEKTDYIDIHWDRKITGYQGIVGLKSLGNFTSQFWTITETNVNSAKIRARVLKATGCDLSVKGTNLWKYLFENSKITFTLWDGKGGTEDATSRVTLDNAQIASSTCFDLAGIPQGYYLTASIPSLNITNTLQWWVNEKLEWEALKNTLADVDEITEYIDYRFMLDDYSDWKSRTVTLVLNKMLKGTVNVPSEEDGETLEARTLALVISEDESKTCFKTVLNVDNVAKEFYFTGMSHRASLVMGYYDYDFDSDDNIRQEVQKSPSKPLVHFGNMLYLVSNNGNVIHSSNCQNPSVIYRIQQVLMANAPILQKPLKSEREEIIADASALREFKITLTDRWLHPVKIKAPLIVTIKMQPIKEDIPTYG